VAAPLHHQDNSVMVPCITLCIKACCCQGSFDSQQALPR
jgi:hypothetical protein